MVCFPALGVIWDITFPSQRAAQSRVMYTQKRPVRITEVKVMQTPESPLMVLVGGTYCDCLFSTADKARSLAWKAKGISKRGAE